MCVMWQSGQFRCILNANFTCHESDVGYTARGLGAKIRNRHSAEMSPPSLGQGYRT